jgi:hypothetical protein
VQATFLAKLRHCLLDVPHEHVTGWEMYPKGGENSGKTRTACSNHCCHPLSVMVKTSGVVYIVVCAVRFKAHSVSYFPTLQTR